MGKKGVSTRVDEELNDWLDATAATVGVSKTTLIRELIEEGRAARSYQPSTHKATEEPMRTEKPVQGPVELSLEAEEAEEGGDLVLTFEEDEEGPQDAPQDELEALLLEWEEENKVKTTENPGRHSDHLSSKVGDQRYARFRKGVKDEIKGELEEKDEDIMGHLAALNLRQARFERLIREGVIPGTPPEAQEEPGEAEDDTHVIGICPKRDYGFSARDRARGVKYCPRHGRHGGLIRWAK